MPAATRSAPQGFWASAAARFTADLKIMKYMKRTAGPTAVRIATAGMVKLDAAITPHVVRRRTPAGQKERSEGRHLRHPSIRLRGVGDVGRNFIEARLAFRLSPSRSRATCPQRLINLFANCSE